MIEIIPAIDIMDGKCVRLEHGDYRLKKVYEEDPLDAARRFEDHGIKRLHMVDLDGAKSKHVINWNSLERIATKTNLVIDFGGGIKTDDDLKTVFDCGASMAIIGSIAVFDHDLFQSWLYAYGSDKIILGADVKEGKIAVSGWLNVTDCTLFEFIANYKKSGVTQVLCTNISKDGMMAGTSLDLYKELTDKFSSMKIIASGGITSVNDIEALDKIGVAGAIIGKAIYEGKIKLDDLERLIN